MDTSQPPRPDTAGDPGTPDPATLAVTPPATEVPRTPDPVATDDRDTGDIIDPDTYDPPPDVVLPGDPGFVEPASGVTPVDPSRLTDAPERPGPTDPGVGAL